MQVRFWVPLVEHVSAKPPQAPNVPQLLAPQLVPSVGRKQPADSTRGLGRQAPDEHT